MCDATAELRRRYLFTERDPESIKLAATVASSERLFYVDVPLGLGGRMGCLDQHFLRVWLGDCACLFLLLLLFFSGPDLTFLACSFPLLQTSTPSPFRTYID
jgi:hypothetical protein